MIKLFAPGKIGNLNLENRLVMLTMHLSWAEEGYVDGKLIEYYRKRAAGGVGLIIVGGCAIDRLGYFDDRMIRLDGEQFIPGLQSLTHAVHSEGAKIMAQLYQAGRYSSSRETGQIPVAPSPLASRMTGEVPHELGQSEIEEIIASYAKAAKIAKAAGFDGVEILASAGYLISQFLSPVTNKREDRYGGDIQGRMTFAKEVVRAVRGAVGDSYPVTARVSGHDYIPGSHTNEEAKIFCRELEREGIDAINVTGGWHESMVPQITMHVPPGTYRYLARGIKEAVSVPVIACNRINDPDLAEEILENGEADFIGMARAFLADPEFVLKAKRGEKQKIRPCIGCNQRCLDHIFKGIPCQCTVNPEAGREFELLNSTPVKEAPLPLNILVVGAGPAGMEYARIAAKKGHRVTIWEESDILGGQLMLAGAPPERQDFLRLRDYLACACQELGVTIIMRKADCDSIKEAVERKEFDQVVIAAGSKPVLPPIPAAGGMQIVQAWDVLAGKVKTGKKVVIVGGGAVGLETAHFLAEIGTLDAKQLRFLLNYRAETAENLYNLASRGSKEITVVEMLKGLGRDIGVSSRWILMSNLKRGKVTLMDEAKVLNITAEGINVDQKGEQRLIEADTIILAVGSRANNALYEQLKDMIPMLSIIGDVAKPAKVEKAMESAYDAAGLLPVYRG